MAVPFTVIVLSCKQHILSSMKELVNSMILLLAALFLGACLVISAINLHLDVFALSAGLVLLLGSSVRKASSQKKAFHQSSESGPRLIQ